MLQAQANQEPFLDTFSLILQDELDRRRSRLMERRYQQSELDERITLADFDWRFNPKLPRAACFELHTLKFVAEGHNALIIGKPALKPLLRALRLHDDDPVGREVGAGRERAYRAGLATLSEEQSPEADYVRQKFKALLASRQDPGGTTGLAAARQHALSRQVLRGGSPYDLRDACGRRDRRRCLP